MPENVGSAFLQGYIKALLVKQFNLTVVWAK